MMSKLERLKSVYNYYVGNYILDTYPMQVGIELTNNCNLKCVMCPHSRMTRQKGFMPEDLFKKIIDEIKGKSEFLYLYGMGESLLHPKFFQMAEYAVKSGLTTSLSTNLTFLNEERSRKVLESGIDFVVLALDGINKNTYEMIRVGGQFEKNLANIKRFLQLKHELKAKCFVEIQFIMMNSNKNEAVCVSEIFTKEEQSVINSYRIKPVYDSPSITTQKIIHKHPCYFLWSTMTITWDGCVIMCCMDYDAEVLLGNINNMSVYEIWNDKKIVSLRRLHKKLNYETMPICDKCSVPEKKYFSAATIIASAVLSTSTIRKLLPIYEKVFLIRKR